MFENFDLTPTHACGPISNAWLKNVSCCRLDWHNFQKYVNSGPCKERKPCVKWINDNYFSRDLWFLKWRALGASSRLYWDWDFGRFRKTSGFFGRVRTSSGVFGNDCVVFKNLSTTRIKISRLYLWKSWQVYYPMIQFLMIPNIQWLSSSLLSPASISFNKQIQTPLYSPVQVL